MDHLLIAYDILAILIGFIALFNAISWALKTGQNDLGNFSIIYGLFTLMMVILVLKKYLFVNVAAYSAQTWYTISGIYHVVDYAVIMATLYYFIDAHQFRHGRSVAVIFLFMMLLCDGLIFSPLGAVLDVEMWRITLFGLKRDISSLPFGIPSHLPAPLRWATGSWFGFGTQRKGSLPSVCWSSLL